LREEVSEMNETVGCKLLREGLEDVEDEIISSIHIFVWHVIEEAMRADNSAPLLSLAEACVEIAEKVPWKLWKH
jgi:hypothetical protein